MATPYIKAGTGLVYRVGQFVGTPGGPDSAVTSTAMTAVLVEGEVDFGGAKVHSPTMLTMDADGGFSFTGPDDPKGFEMILCYVAGRLCWIMPSRIHATGKYSTTTQGGEGGMAGGIVFALVGAAVVAWWVWSKKK